MNTHRDPTGYELTTTRSPGRLALPRAQPMHAPSEPETAAATFDVDLMEIVRAIWRRRWVVIATMVVGGLLAALVATILPKSYTSYARVMLETRSSNLVGEGAVLGQLDPTSEVVETEIQVVVSRTVKERVVESLGLVGFLEKRALEAQGDRTPSFLNSTLTVVGDLAPPSIVASFGLPTSKPREPTTVDDAVRFLDDRLGAAQVGNTAVIEVAVSDEEAPMAAMIANAVVDQYLADQLEYKNEANSGANAWLSDRIEELRASLAAKRADLEDARIRSGVVDGDGSSVITQQQIITNERLLEARGERIRLESEVERLRQAMRSQGVDALAAMFDSEVLEELRLEIALANRELAELASIYGPRHPRILDTEARLARTSADLEREARASLASREAGLAAARAEERQLATELDSYISRGQAVSGQRTVVSGLEGEIEAMQEVLDSYLTRQQETSAQSAIIRPDARPISPAVTPEFPDPPGGLAIVLIGLFLSGGIGMVLAYMRDSLDRSLRSVADAEKALQIPVIAALPKLPGGGKRTAAMAADYVVQRPASAYTEAVRTLLTNIGVAKDAGSVRRLLITSAVPGEGKSSLSASIARVLRRADLNVALIDCDMRRPSLAPALRCVERPGLLQYLKDDAPILDIAQADPATGLTFIAAGGGTDNSLFLLQSERMRQLCDWLEARHDFVIIDSPPVLLLSDAQALAEHADAIIFLSRWGHTPRASSAAAVRMLVRRGGPMVYGALSIADAKKIGSYDGAYHKSAGSRYYVD